MIKQHISSVLILVLCSSGLAFAAAAHLSPLPQGKRLRELASDNFPKGNFYIGGTTGWKKRPQGSGVIVDREFNYICPENDYKQSTAHPQPDKWNWSLGDAWVEHAKKTGQVIRLHGPISPQSSKWAKDDSRTAEELKKKSDRIHDRTVQTLQQN